MGDLRVTERRVSRWLRQATRMLGQRQPGL